MYDTQEHTPIVEPSVFRESRTIAKMIFRAFMLESVMFATLMALAPVMAFAFRGDKSWVLRASPALLVVCALLVIFAAFAKKLPHERSVD